MAKKRPKKERSKGHRSGEVESLAKRYDMSVAELTRTLYNFALDIECGPLDLFLGERMVVMNDARLILATADVCARTNHRTLGNDASRAAGAADREEAGRALGRPLTPEENMDFSDAYRMTIYALFRAAAR